MNIYLVILLIVGIIVFSNLAMLGAARGSRGMKLNWLNTTKDGIAKPFKKEDDQLSELRQRVEGLSQEDQAAERSANSTTE